MLFGLVVPTAGEVRVFGADVSRDRYQVAHRMNFQSPYVDMPMRLTVRELGGLGWATTDLVNARSLIEKKLRALKLIETAPKDQPLAVQLFGSVPEEMRDAAAKSPIDKLKF